VAACIYAPKNLIVLHILGNMLMLLLMIKLKY
jgi:hypothetical protein